MIRPRVPVRVLYVESYDTGSHARTLDLWLQHSNHTIQPVRIPPSYWKWTTGTAHYLVEKIINVESKTFDPEVIVLSGPMNVPATLLSLPDLWRTLPVAYFFHESQWTYPTNDDDIQHYLLGHLDTIRFSNQLWFNSKFHRRTFWKAAIENPSERIRHLARTVLRDRWQDTRIIYPPVTAPERRHYVNQSLSPKRILWCARWEEEKRPDRFVAAIAILADAGKLFELAVLGPGSGPDPIVDPLFNTIKHHVAVRGPLRDRSDYEDEVLRSDIIVSTTDHEFFGIAVLEAALAGAVPVLPNAHAYPETLPSAIFYQDGNVEMLASHLARVIDHRWGTNRPWVLDASRFLPKNSVETFDKAVEQLTHS